MFKDAREVLRGVILVATMGIWSACGDSGGSPLQLPSGQVVEVLSRGVVAESPRTWVIRYQTRVPSADRTRLDAEAMELWAQVQPEVDSCGATRASLWPANLDSHALHFDGWRPVLYTHHSFDFQFEKDASGVWKHVPHIGRVERPLVW